MKGIFNIRFINNENLHKANTLGKIVIIQILSRNGTFQNIKRQELTIKFLVGK